MAGAIPGQKKQTPEILFDLTPEDDILIQESDLLQLVNHGQLQKPVLVPGTNGKMYEIEMALLWDDDHADVLRRTSAFVPDPILRLRLMRRIKLHKAIQRINNIDYSNKEDPAAQRQLWAVLCRLADAQMEFIDNQYSKLELERNLSFVESMKALNIQLNETAPEDIKPKNKEKPANKTAEEHIQFMAQAERSRKEQGEALANVIAETITGKTGAAEPAEPEIPEVPIEQEQQTEGKRPIVGSPRQKIKL
jgi:hypothetical protein